MSFEQFIKNWLGKRTDYDHVYAYQCVDLILQYLADVHGIRQGVWGNAIDYWTKPTATLLQSFSKVTGTPQAGDIVILKPTSTNPYGHIMIAVNSTTGIEQNGYSGDGDGLNGDEVRYRTIPTTRVAGLLRKKGTNMAYIEDAALKDLQLWKEKGMLLENERDTFSYPTIEAQKARIADLTAIKNELEHDRDTNIYPMIEDFKAQLMSLKSQLEEAVKVQNIKDNVIAEQRKQIESLKAQVGDNSKWETFKALIRELVKG